MAKLMAKLYASAKPSNHTDGTDGYVLELYRGDTDNGMWSEFAAEFHGDEAILIWQKLLDSVGTDNEYSLATKMADKLTEDDV